MVLFLRKNIKTVFKAASVAIIMLIASNAGYSQGQLAGPACAKIGAFTGESGNEDNTLTWTTTSETGSSYFTLERSCDHVNWEEVGKLKGEGNSAQQLSYSLKDEAAFPGFTYYRVKEVATDGSFAYSQSIVIESKMKISLEIYPNPAAGLVKITVLGKENEYSHVSVKSLSGQMLFSADVVNNLPVELDLEEYPDGVYTVEAKDNTGSVISKLIKK
jgi:hypothetical protein